MTTPPFRHIELCGVAASGKSSAALVLCDLFRRRGERTVTATGLPRLAAAQHRSRIFGAVLPTSLLRWITPDTGVPALGRFVAGRPAVLSVLSDALSRPDMNDEDRRAAANALFQTATCYQLASECLHKNEILLLDEGFAHRGITTFGYPTGNAAQDLVERYVGSIPCPDWLVVMDTPIHVCIARIRKRPAPPRPYMAGMSDPDLAQRLAGAATRLDTVVQALARRGARVIRVNGNTDAEDLRNMLSAVAREESTR